MQDLVAERWKTALRSFKLSTTDRERRTRPGMYVHCGYAEATHAAISLQERFFRPQEAQATKPQFAVGVASASLTDEYCDVRGFAFMRRL